MLHGEEHAQQIDLEKAAHHRCFDRRQFEKRLPDAGVVHRDIEPVEAVKREPDESRGGALIGHVAGQRGQLDAPSAQGARHIAEFTRVDVAQHKPRAFIGEALRRATAEAPRGARNENGFASEALIVHRRVSMSATAMRPKTGTAAPSRRARSGLDALPSSARRITPCKMAASRKKLKAR